MIAQMAILKLVYWLCIVLSSILSFFDFGIYIVPIILIFILGLTISSIPLNIAWSEETYGSMILQCVVNIVFSIFIYSIFYVKNGLVVGGELTNIDLSTAVYFSGTTWTTVGYGDISAPEGIRLLTTFEAITGYIAMAVLMALIVLWLDDTLKSARQYRKWLDKASQQDIESATGHDISELATKVKE